MPGWLKAGLIGSLILIVLSLISLIPIFFIACFTYPLLFLACLAIGALAASYIPTGRQPVQTSLTEGLAEPFPEAAIIPGRSPSRAAGQGALAVALAALVSGLVNTVITTVRWTAVNPQDFISQLPPIYQQQLVDAGISPAMMFSTPMVALYGSLCCSGGILIGAALGAIGGLIYAALKPD